MKTKFNPLLLGLSAFALGALFSSGCASTESNCCTAPSAAPAATAATPPAPADAAMAASKPTLKFVKVDSEETAGENGRGANVVDGDTSTIWHTQWQDDSPACPHEIVLELAPMATIKGFTYLPRQDESENGMIKEYEFYVSTDGQNFGQPVTKGSFDGGKDLKTVNFPPQPCHYLKLKAVSEINGEAWASAAEINVVQ